MGSQRVGHDFATSNKNQRKDLLDQTQTPSEKDQNDLGLVSGMEYSIDKDPADWLEINPRNGTIRTTGILDRESPFVLSNVYTAYFLAIDSGSPPATGTGTLQIVLADDNDNAPSLYQRESDVCEDAKDVKVVFGALDKDIHPNTEPFKFELGKQFGQDKAWKITRINNTHAEITLPQNLKKANYNIPISVTDSGNPPLTNNTELIIHVCSCTKNKVDCSASPTLHISMVLIFVSLLSLYKLATACERERERERERRGDLCAKVKISQHSLRLDDNEINWEFPPISPDPALSSDDDCLETNSQEAAPKVKVPPSGSMAMKVGA
ncbi:Cadherin-13 [Varanus komodoensis]|nr:Cadherin-13 [Varanus komodoensis]